LAQVFAATLAHQFFQPAEALAQIDGLPDTVG
jgi:hypothetical protein